MLKTIFYRKNKPIGITFIFGAARGGTTWLWSLLESHKRVKPFTNGAGRGKDGLYDTSESGIYIKNRQNARSIIRQYLKQNRDFLIVEKTPSHTFYWKDIVKDFPKSKNIIILRNPLAIVNSMQHSNMEFLEGFTLDKSLFTVKEYYKYLMEIASLTSFHVVRYEDLLADSEGELKKILDYLELDDYDITRIVEENKNVSKVSVKGVYRKGLKDSYIKEVGHEDLEYLKSKLKKEIIFFNSYAKF